ncbi:hypothetical protein CN918_31265 [Priestia megaterium]|nr:hypothetical protein CN918_31265 [Priestia megaterium]
MIRGLTLRCPNEYGRHLGKILEPLGIEKYQWQFVGGEAYGIVNDELSDDLFPNENSWIVGEEFRALINQESYYPIFAHLQAWPNKELNQIQTYEDFLSSNCKMVILVADTEFVTIYIKSDRQVHALHEHAIKQGYQDVTLLNDENDTRTYLDF